MLQKCYTATVLQKLGNSKNNKVKQSNAATMLQCNSATEIKKQQKQESQLYKAKLQQWYTPTVLQELSNSNNNKVKATLKQCYTATALQEL